MNEDKNLNEKLIQMLGGLDKEKLEKVANMVKVQNKDEEEYYD